MTEFGRRGATADGLQPRISITGNLKSGIRPFGRRLNHGTQNHFISRRLITRSAVADLLPHRRRSRRNFRSSFVTSVSGLKEKIDLIYAAEAGCHT